MSEENKDLLENEQEMTLEEAFRELDGLIGEMQGQDKSLEDTFALYKRGISLVEMCTKKIEKVECDIKKLSPELDG